MTENSAKKQRGAPFRKGQSGNPSGKPRGTRNRTTVLAEKLMQDDARDIVQAVLAAAKNGDMTAARLILERISPVRKGRPVYLELPSVKTAADVSAAIGGADNGDGRRRRDSRRGGIGSLGIRGAAQGAGNGGT